MFNFPTKRINSRRIL